MFKVTKKEFNIYVCSFFLFFAFIHASVCVLFNSIKHIYKRKVHTETIERNSIQRILIQHC